MSTEETLIDHEQRLSTLQGSIPPTLQAIQDDLKEVKQLVRDHAPGTGNTCTDHGTRIEALENQMKDRASNGSVSRLWAAFALLVTTILTVLTLFATIHGPVNH